MVDYYACIKLKFPNINDNQFLLEDDGNEVKVLYWDQSLGEQPSLPELNSYMLQVLKNNKKELIKQFVHDEVDKSSIGYMTQGLANNFRIDAGRGDLDNLRNLKQYCAAVNINTTYIKDFYNNMHQVSIQELDTIILELIAYGLWLYQRKWEVDILIDNASSEEEVNSIVFFS